MRLRSLLSQAVFMVKTVAAGNVVREYVSAYADHPDSRHYDVASTRFRFATPRSFPLQQPANWTERSLLEHSTCAANVRAERGSYR